MMSPLRKSIFLLSTIAFSLWLSPSLSRAATFCVNDQTDSGTGVAGDCSDAACSGSSGACSLRDAIAAANANADEDTITFSASLTSPLLVSASTSLPNIFTTVHIEGPGADVLAIDANDNNTLFDFDPSSLPSASSVSNLTLTGVTSSLPFTYKVRHDGGDLTISDCVITGGGRGIIKVSGVGALTINNSTISGNSTNANDDLTGGGLNFGGGTLTISNSTFSGNTRLNTGGTLDLDEGGGGIGIFDGSDSTVQLTNVTISGNQTNENGGGIWISDNCGECTGTGIIDVTLTHVTIADNVADLDGNSIGIGGGIYVSLTNVGAAVRLNNTLIADNLPGSSVSDPDCAVISGGLSSNGANLVGNATGCDGLVGTDLTDTDPLLAALTLNPPGSTATQALDSGSPAINAADAADCPAFDQRGIPRPQGSACDIGAYEAVVCGDGMVGPGEECETGDECCASDCLFEAAGTACADGTCDDAGQCVSDGGGGGGCAFGSTSDPLFSILGLSPMLVALAGLVLFRKKLK